MVQWRARSLRPLPLLKPPRAPPQQRPPPPLLNPPSRQWKTKQLRCQRGAASDPALQRAKPRPFLPSLNLPPSALARQKPVPPVVMQVPSSILSSSLETRPVSSLATSDAATPSRVPVRRRSSGREPTGGRGKKRQSRPSPSSTSKSIWLCFQASKTMSLPPQAPSSLFLHPSQGVAMPLVV